jgi:hypothetical protein
MSSTTETLKDSGYTFNQTDKKYVFHTESLVGRNYVLDESKVDTILKLYSNFDKSPFTAGEIAQRTSTPKKVIEYIVRKLGINHSSIPYTDEKIKESEPESLVSDLLLEKRANIEQKFERRDWKQTIADAENWRLFNHNYKEVFDNTLKSWNPPKYIPTKVEYKPTGDKELVIGCSDWHYGLVASERYLYNQKEWNIEKTKESVEKYAEKLVSHIIERGNPYKRVTLAFLGDILHGLDGFTDKGTKLEAHPLKEDQLEEAYNSVLAFIQTLLAVIGNIRVVAVPGNHSSFGDYFLLKMLSIYFKDDKRLTFEITSKRFLTFKIERNLFLLDHGYAPTSRSRLPAPGTGRENYINNLFMAKPKDMQGIDRNFYISADQHHMESAELTNVETYMFSTLVGGCRHADTSGYKSRQRQSCLVVGEEGVSEFLHFYFD